MPAPERFLFIHIPKTAGVSLNAIIEKNFKKEEILDLFFMRDAVKLSDEEISSYRLVRGHQAYSLVEKFTQRPRLLLMLRDPVQRSISNLRYAKNIGKKDFWLQQQYDLKDMSMDDMVKIPEVQDWLRDYQVKWVAGNFNLRNFTTPMIFQIPKTVGKEYLDEAKRRLHVIDFVGITEKFAESAELMCKTFGWEKPAQAPNINTAKERGGWHEELSAKSMKIIHEITQLDRELYNHALKIFEQRRKVL